MLSFSSSLSLSLCLPAHVSFLIYMFLSCHLATLHLFYTHSHTHMRAHTHAHTHARTQRSNVFSPSCSLSVCLVREVNPYGLSHMPVKHSVPIVTCSHHWLGS